MTTKTELDNLLAETLRANNRGAVKEAIRLLLTGLIPAVVDYVENPGVPYTSPRAEAEALFAGGDMPEPWLRSSAPPCEPCDPTPENPNGVATGLDLSVIDALRAAGVDVEKLVNDSTTARTQEDLEKGVSAEEAEALAIKEAILQQALNEGKEAAMLEKLAAFEAAKVAEADDEKRPLAEVAADLGIDLEAEITKGIADSLAAEGVTEANIQITHNDDGSVSVDVKSTDGPEEAAPAVETAPTPAKPKGKAKPAAA